MCGGVSSHDKVCSPRLFLTFLAELRILSPASERCRPARIEVGRCRTSNFEELKAAESGGRTDATTVPAAPTRASRWSSRLNGLHRTVLEVMDNNYHARLDRLWAAGMGGLAGPDGELNFSAAEDPGATTFLCALDHSNVAQQFYVHGSKFSRLKFVGAGLHTV